MIRWGYISSDASSKSLTTYSIENNVFIESYMDDFGRNDGLYANEFSVYGWNIENKNIPNNIFPESDSYISCETIYFGVVWVGERAGGR